MNMLRGVWEKSGRPPVDRQQLVLGMKIEMEHTDRKDVAQRIALDHLTEIPDYYTRLLKMEREAYRSWKNRS